MLSKEEVEAGKQCLKDVIVNTYAEGKAIKLENLYKYIEHLEAKLKELGKGQITLMQSRKKWKNRYYKERGKRKELIEKLEEDIKILNSEERITPELVHKAVESVYAQKLLAILKGEKEV